MLAVALGRAAVDAGHRVDFTTAADLAKRCKRAALEGRWATAIGSTAGPGCRSSTSSPTPAPNLIPTPRRPVRGDHPPLPQDLHHPTSHAVVGSWGERLADPMPAAAPLDRLLHRGIVVAIDGPSFRMRPTNSAATSCAAPGPTRPAMTILGEHACPTCDERTR